MGASLDSEGYYYSVGSYIDGGAYGPYAESNAVKLAGELIHNYGWTEVATAAWFGAITFESQFNPAQIEGNLTTPTTNSGVGYIQWTPSSQLISFCEQWGVRWQLTSSQLRKWELERTTTDSDIRQWFVMQPYVTKYHSVFPNNTPLPSMQAFTQASLNQYDWTQLSAQIILFYTRPASWDNTENWYRNAKACEYWYSKIRGVPTPISKKKMPVWMMVRRIWK